MPTDTHNATPKTHIVLTPATAAVLCLGVIALFVAFKVLTAEKPPVIPPAPAYPDLSPRVTDLEQQLTAAKSDPPPYPNLSEKVAALEATQAELQRLLAEAQAAPEYVSLRNRLAALESELEATRDALATAQKGSAEAQLRVERDDLAGRTARLTREVTQLRDDRERMQKLLAETGRQMRQASAVRTAPSRSETALAATIDELQATRAALAAAQEESNRTHEALDALQRSAARISAESTTDRARLDQLRSTNASLTQENQRLRATAATSGAPVAPPVYAAMPVAVARTHVVASGDSLSSLSQRYYGTPARWQEIYNANAELLGPAGTLRTGTVLRIP